MLGGQRAAGDPTSSVEQFQHGDRGAGADDRGTGEPPVPCCEHGRHGVIDVHEIAPLQAVAVNLHPSAG
jgi:hypothetical protein